MTDDIDIIVPRVADYALAHSTPPDAVLQRLRETTAAEVGEHAIMQISPLQGAFMSVLTAALQPKLAVEIGTFTGYSALTVARAMPADGRLICCDVSEEWTGIARQAWAEAGVADRIDLRIGPAIDTLRSLPEDMAIDLAFIDADKTGYIDYFEELVPRLAPHGIILVDNVLWSGSVADESDRSESTVALREFSRHVLDDDRVDVAVLPVGDGMSMIGRRHR